MAGQPQHNLQIFIGLFSSTAPWLNLWRNQIRIRRLPKEGRGLFRKVGIYIVDKERKMRKMHNKSHWTNI